MNKYSGSNFDDFLAEEGILEEVSDRTYAVECPKPCSSAIYRRRPLSPILVSPMESGQA